ncbi:MAG: LytR C-terminal domain-containing protein [Bacteroidetes bacterium]|nr:LytR C-terminal domain-containing protein [Bacteroidota bacterium]
MSDYQDPQPQPELPKPDFFPEPKKPWIVNATLGLAILLCLFFVVSLIIRFSNPPSDPSRLDPEKIDPKLVIQVQVLNGNGVPKITDQIISYLRQQGFDVVEKGNYSSFNAEHSVVLDRVGDKAAANKLAEVLGIIPARVLSQISYEYYADLTLVIGKDFKNLTPFSKK